MTSTNQVTEIDCKITFLMTQDKKVFWKSSIQLKVHQIPKSKFKSTLKIYFFSYFEGMKRRRLKKGKDSQTQEIAVFFGLFYRPRGKEGCSSLLYSLFFEGKKRSQIDLKRCERGQQKKTIQVKANFYIGKFFFLEKIIFHLQKLGQF